MRCFNEKFHFEYKSRILDNLGNKRKLKKLPNLSGLFITIWSSAFLENSAKSFLPTQGIPDVGTGADSNPSYYEYELKSDLGHKLFYPL